MAKTPYFTPALFRFLKQLRKNNDREWFRANRARYEETVRDPSLLFVAAFSAPLERISKHLVADPRPVGGSLFRIHRDVRFSRDKRPYKTHAGIHFRHEAARDVHAPGLYLHLEPGNVFAGAGIWHPDSATLTKIRDAVVEEPELWIRLRGGRMFRDGWTLAGDSLKRAPRGIDAAHPLLEDLRRKDYIGVARFSEEEACRADFADRLERRLRSASPLMRFLTGALSLPW
jgi:uncharacterized protein (TIGR02453 family)